MTRWYRFVSAIGFEGSNGLSFNKMVTFTALWVFVYCVVTRREPSWALLSFGIIVIGAGFGLKGYLGGVNRNSFNAQHSTTLTGDMAQVMRAAADVWRDDERGEYRDRDYGT